MAELTFYGSSDDLMEVEGVVTEEYNGEGGEFLVAAPDGARGIVTMRYEKDGNWSVGFRPAEEYAPSFEGRVGVNTLDYPGEGYRAYSARLVLDVPAGTTVEMVGVADEVT